MTEAEFSEMDLEELEVRVGDIDNFRLTRPILRERVEEIVQENLPYNEAYRNFPAQDINSNTVHIPVPDDSIGTPQIVAEGAEFPREQETYTDQTMTFNKFGFEVALTHEAQEDSMLNVVSDQVDRQARQMAEEMNNQAFTDLNNNVNSTVGDADGVFTYDDVLAGRRELMTDNYDPDLLIADIDASHDLLADANFLDSSEMQGEMRRSGQIGEIAGLDVVQADGDNNITGNTNPGAFIVDTGFFGYEGVREDITTEEYREDQTQTDVFRIYNRVGWLTVQPHAGAAIEG